MIAGSLSALFLCCGLLAIVAIAATWRRYGPEARALRGALADCEPWREVRVTIRETTIKPIATVLRPDFTAPVRHPSPRPGLRAAA